MTRASPLLMLLFLGLEATATSPHDFDVDFAGCTEYVGIGFVPAANAAPLVPAGYTVVEVGADAIVVVRIAECDGVSVGGKKAKPGTVAHVGISIVGDGTADIDNYTLWFATDHALLHAKLRGAGVDSVHDNHLALSFTPDGAGGGSVFADVDPPRGTDYVVCGTGEVPVAAPVPFVARWWQEGTHAPVAMTTTFPAIQFAEASVTLTTTTGSEMAQLIGGTSLDFVLLDSHNAYLDAAMEVRLQ